MVECWTGGLHAGTVVKGLYLKWTLGPMFLSASGRALDAGCGEGANFARLLARRLPGWRFVAIDLAHGGAPPSEPNVSRCVGDLRALPVVGPFDVVYNIDVLEHVDDPPRLLAAFAACLRPHGILYLHVPASEQRHFLPGVDREYSWLGPPSLGDVHLFEGFDPVQLASWLQEAGFAVVSTRRTFGTAVSVLKELFMLAEARRVPGVGLALLPFLALAARLEWWWGGRRGNGVCIVARRMASAGRPRSRQVSTVGARG
ncbi:MAG: hypothetical protein AUH30_16560 [Candidatus Rokubacteria bacterium 13_1_40CM_68_15]|nr:MAG: hypothetical protein AUH30_16560 [Candidatus Rokubacteria bacterium 13_1_40CM_68_15]